MEHIIIILGYLPLLAIITYLCRSNRSLKRDIRKLNEILKLPETFLYLKKEIDDLKDEKTN